MYFPNEILRCRKQCERPMVFPSAIATIFHFLFVCVLCRVEKEIPKETGSLIECVDKHVVYTVFQKNILPKKSSRVCNTICHTSANFFSMVVTRAISNFSKILTFLICRMQKWGKKIGSSLDMANNLKVAFFGQKRELLHF